MPTRQMPLEVYEDMELRVKNFGGLQLWGFRIWGLGLLGVRGQRFWKV